MTKAVAEFLHLPRMQGEGIDAFLVCYDVLRHRADNQGGLGINATGAAWMLLRAVRCSDEQWERLLAPNNGQLPQDEPQLGQLIERARRLEHLHEGGLHHHPHQGATENFGHFYFPTFGGGADRDGGFGGPGMGMGGVQQQQKLQRSSFRSTFAAFLSRSAFAGGPS